MSAHRRISLAFGVLYLITFITSIPALGLFQPVLDDPRGCVGAGVLTTKFTSGRCWNSF